MKLIDDSLQSAFASRVKLAGLDPETSLVGDAPREGEETLRTEDILAVIEKEGPETSLVLFGAVQWYNGQFLDLEAITRAGNLAVCLRHRATSLADAVLLQGCMVGWDCAHAVGNVPLRLHDWGVDFAVWCTYKVSRPILASTAPKLTPATSESTSIRDQGRPLRYLSTKTISIG